MILSQTKTFTDHFQFAYCPGRGVDDAILTLLHNIYEHLDRPLNFVRTLFTDFSSAFNTIQPHLLIKKLHNMNVNPQISLWINQFLLNRTQRVKLMDSVSDVIQISTGAPQGCVLSPVLFSLYTSDYRSNDASCLMIKYADDTSLTGKISLNDETQYRKEICEFVNCCDKNFLVINVNKTKEIVFDFRKDKSRIEPVFIKETPVEMVTEYKYLGMFIDSNLNWNFNTQKIAAKANQRIFFLRKLNTFNVSSHILYLFYQSVIQSIMTFCFIVWYSELTVKNKQKLERVTKLAAKIIGMDVKELQGIFEANALTKLNLIMKDSTHPLHARVVVNKSRRIRPLQNRTKRFRMSFLPNVCHLFNNAFKR